MLLRGSSSRPYAAVSADRSGRRLAFIRGQEVFRARAGGRSRQRIGTALRQAAPEVHVRPDGGEVAWIDVLQRPDLISGGVYYERNLLSLKRGAAPGDERIVATDMLSAGWLGSSLMRQAFGDSGAPWFACTVTAEAGCVRNVAVDPTRFLDQPAGSADGRRVAAVALPAAPGARRPRSAGRSRSSTPRPAGAYGTSPPAETPRPRSARTAGRSRSSAVATCTRSRSAAAVLGAWRRASRARPGRCGR